MKAGSLVVLNTLLIVLLLVLFRRPNLLSYYFKGKWWLTWLSIAVITLMDELSSVFYAPAEAYRFIGPSALFFIVFTSIFIHYMSTRLVEIADILEHHGLIGGGVYSFSYLVLGPMVSFAAVASIMVTYILTACLSSVSAVLNATSFFPMSHATNMVLVLLVIWSIAVLNILGIKGNARFVFAIFIFASFIFLNLIVSCVIDLDAGSLSRFENALHHTAERLHTGSWVQGYEVFIASVASCILAYSGVESVLQTAGLVRSWREIGKAYIFLAATVGIVTPLVAALAFIAPIDFSQHEGDLITYFATMVNGVWFGAAVALLASLALIMAVNTAFVASSELVERVAQRYQFRWLLATNRQQSLYRIHLVNAAFFCTIIFLTQGSQMILADMYALGLIASFCINIGSLLIYRYFRGTDRMLHFHTSRLITLVMFIIFVSCFVFLAINKLQGTLLWASVTSLVLLAGFLVAQKRAPEIREIEKTDSEMEMILYLALSSSPKLRIAFRRPREITFGSERDDEAYVTFFSPRQGIPQKQAANHFRFPLPRQISLFQRIVAVLKVVEYEFPDRSITVDIGWPLSSWIDRLSIGVMVFNLMRLPRIFPKFQFHISYLPSEMSAAGESRIR
ncbi:MAG TPA: amino acid permease [Thermodesulfobacteriota bacterium]|nr:amino acid permease [Thermodesulfobacteriota bacterium]